MRQSIPNYKNDEHPRDRQFSPLPSPLVVKVNPEEEIKPDMTIKSNNSPQTAVSRRKSCSKGAMEILWME